MKLSAWAKKQGICYKTAWRWCRDNKMPVKFVVMPTGMIFVCDDELNWVEPAKPTAGGKLEDSGITGKSQETEGESK